MLYICMELGNATKAFEFFCNALYQKVYFNTLWQAFGGVLIWIASFPHQMPRSFVLICTTLKHIATTNLIHLKNHSPFTRGYLYIFLCVVVPSFTSVSKEKSLTDSWASNLYFSMHMRKKAFKQNVTDKQQRSHHQLRKEKQLVMRWKN
jgi:hypothetical protein